MNSADFDFAFSMPAIHNIPVEIVCNLMLGYFFSQFDLEYLELKVKDCRLDHPRV